MKKIISFITSNKDFRVAVFLCIISIILPSIWFQNGTYVAGGDVGLPVVMPQRALDIQSSSWWWTNATGNANPMVYTAVPFYVILSIFDKLGFSPNFLQKGLFFIIIFGGSLSIYFLAQRFNLNRKVSFLAAIFYIFNLTSLSVWQRGVHNAMLFLLLAPLSLLFLVIGLQKEKFRSIIWINVVCFLLSYVFGALGYLFSLWLLWLVYILVNLLAEWKDKRRRNFIFSYTIILFVSWFGTNLWWLWHFFQSGLYAFGGFSSGELKSRGAGVLVGLRSSHSQLYILRGLSGYYHYVVKDWGESYLNPFMILLSWFPVLVIFLTGMVKNNYKSVYWKFLFVLTAIVLFFSKGVNLPLGGLNQALYDYFPILAPIRNPYEKIGILLSLTYSLLFAIGLYQIIVFFIVKHKAFLKYFVIIAFILTVTVLVWPLWTGTLFNSGGKQYTVSFPNYYFEASKWLNDKIGDSRILHLPLAPGESTEYNWGYTGVEPSFFIFPGASIGYSIGLPGVDDRVKDLVMSFHNQNSANIMKSLASLNVGWVVVHNETNWKVRVLESPDRINDWLQNKQQFLEHVIDFGPLAIWKVKDQYRLGHFFIADKLSEFTNQENTKSKVWDEINSDNDAFVVKPSDSLADALPKDLEKFSQKTVVMPKTKFRYTDLSGINTDIALNELGGNTRYSPDSFLYPLVRLKEKMYKFLSQDDPLNSCFILSSRRLVESVILNRLRKNELVDNALDDYKDQLDLCLQTDMETVKIYFSITDVSRQDSLGQLIRQRAIVENEFKDTQFAEKAFKISQSLNEFIANLGFYPKFDPKTGTPKTKQSMVYSYSIPQDGEYSIKLQGTVDDLIKPLPVITQIDDQVVNLELLETNNKTIKYPSVKLNKGYHEIHLLINKPDNLIEKSVQAKKQSPDPGVKIGTDPDTGQEIFIGEAIADPATVKFDIGNVDIGKPYMISYDIKMVQGQIPEVMVVHDTDPIDKKGEIIPAYKVPLLFGSYPLVWRSLSFMYTPPLNATTAQLVFGLYPRNNCLPFLGDKKCDDLTTTGIFARPIVAWLTNIEVNKVFYNDITLENAEKKETKDLGSAKINWRKIDPTDYELTLQDQKPPFILAFSETSHPLWKITDSLGKFIDLPHFSINGYANAWLVEKSLPDKIRIKFVLQDARNQGILFSVVSLLLLTIVVFYLDHRRKLND